MSNPWLRLYAEFADDPKVQMMSEPMQRRLIMLFCEHCKGETLHETERAFHWRVTETEMKQTKTVFLEKGFIDETWRLLNWNKRQFVSDTSTNRVRRHRQGKKQGETLQKQDGTFLKRDGTVDETVLEQPVPVTVTAPDTDTDEEQKKERSKDLSQEKPGLAPLSPAATRENFQTVALFGSPEPPGAGPPPKPALTPRSPDALEQLVEIWNLNCGDLPKVRDLTRALRTRVGARIRGGLTRERFLQAVVCCATKPFLRGEGPAGWRADFKWLLENDERVEEVIAKPYLVPGANGHGKLSVTQAGVYRQPESPAEIAADRERQEAAHQRYVIGLANSPPKVREDMLRHGQCTQADIDEGFRLVPELARRVQ